METLSWFHTLEDLKGNIVLQSGLSTREIIQTLLSSSIGRSSSFT